MPLLVYVVKSTSQEVGNNPLNKTCLWDVSRLTENHRLKDTRAGIRSEFLSPTGTESAHSSTPPAAVGSLLISPKASFEQ
jgi:hypothetical protein